MVAKMIMPDLVGPGSSTSFIHTLAWLKRVGVSLDNIRLLLKGVFENYKGEIINHLPPPGAEIDSSTVALLGIGSASMVDQLPPSLFFVPRREYLDLDKMELESRKLFSCFDSAIAKITATLEYVLLVYDSVFLEESFSERFVGAFGFPEEGWNSEELFLWTMFLPGFHQWAGTKKGTQEVLSKLFGIQFRIKENERGENSLPPEVQSLLGKRWSQLGSDWSLGNSFSECESSFRVVIGPISACQVRDFLPLGAKRKKLDRILNHCVPGQLRWGVALKLKEKEKIFSLGESTHNCVLGYSTYLNRSEKTI
jgi:hypothetical protein